MSTSENPHQKTPARQGPARSRRVLRAQDNGFGEFGISFIWAVLIFAPILALGSGMIYPKWAEQHRAQLAEAEAAGAYNRLLVATPEPMLRADIVTRGKHLFATTCAACHGSDGRGAPGLGTDVVRSDFVAARGDDELVDFINRGVPGGQPVPMPPRGGRDDLTDADLSAIVAYMRGLQDPRRMPEIDETAMPEPEPVVAAAPEGVDDELAAHIARGARLYASSCMACHGRDGAGVRGLGTPLTGTDFMRRADDDALFTVIKRGRTAGDPANTTGIAMPPKGGNPSLDDDDILDIMDYLRSLNQAGGR